MRKLASSKGVKYLLQVTQNQPSPEELETVLQLALDPTETKSGSNACFIVMLGSTGIAECYSLTLFRKRKDLHCRLFGESISMRYCLFQTLQCYRKP